MIQRKKGSKAKAKPLPIDDREFKEVVVKTLKFLIENHRFWEYDKSAKEEQESLINRIDKMLNPKSQEMPFKDTLEEKE